MKAGVWCVCPVTATGVKEWRWSTASKSPLCASCWIRSTTEVIPDIKSLCAADVFALPATEQSCFTKRPTHHTALPEEPHLGATGRHLPYGITQCYLPPDTSERAPPNPSQYNTIQEFITRTMSVSWQNRRRGQSLVKNSSKIICFKNNYVWMNWLVVRCRYLEVWRSRFMRQRNWKCDDLLMCRLNILLESIVKHRRTSTDADRQTHLSPVHTVAEKWDCRRKRRDNGETRRLSHFSATVWTGF